MSFLLNRLKFGKDFVKLLFCLGFLMNIGVIFFYIKFFNLDLDLFKVRGYSFICVRIIWRNITRR